MTRPRRDYPAPLPGTVKVRMVGADEDMQRVLDVLRAYYTCTEPAGYSGGRAYLDIDTQQPTPPAHPEV